MGGKSGRRATLTDVAKRAGVSLKTASRVLNGVATVDEQLARNVREASEQLAYRPHRGAATIRSGTSDMIGMLIRDMSNPFYSALAAGASEVCEDQGCLVITSSSEGEPPRQRRLLEAMLDQRPRGLLITPSPGAEAILTAELQWGTAVVAIDEPLTGLETDCITFENHASAKAAVLETRPLGLNTWAVLSDTVQLTTMPERVSGALAGISDLGAEIRDSAIRQDVHTVKDGYAATSMLLDHPDRPDAIFCSNHMGARGAAQAVTERGADTAIITFDQFPLGEVMPFPLLTVEHDDRELGREAARLLFQRLEHPDGPVQRLWFPTRCTRNRRLRNRLTAAAPASRL
ncbi:LacI family transcriptional regulator [Arachnia propionica]|uniref:LacI family transcriptional regulator n=1 Tax=Arachnia propionica TaxID=1750 RepID=A0A3P1T3G0_9ACTN|nr:LacI family DNA-binding transcriptional regulator [Arachnia propionica]RRD03834.1 LacI family transcriptional regulator [Arachnia propionica]